MWTIAYSAAAFKALKRMPTDTARLIRGKLERLADDPRAINNNVKALKETPAFSVAGGRLAGDLRTARRGAGDSMWSPSRRVAACMIERERGGRDG